MGEPMTPAALRNIADWLDEYDDMAEEFWDFLQLMEIGTPEKLARVRAATRGTEVQDDLRRWADDLLGKPDGVQAADFVAFQRQYVITCPACGDAMRCQRCDELERCEVCATPHDERDGWSVDGDRVHLCPDHTQPLVRGWWRGTCGDCGRERMVRAFMFPDEVEPVWRCTDCEPVTDGEP